jgi:acyl carrier protein
MPQLSPMELEIARLVVESLNLETEPETIDPVAPLYREGLGLDSIDMLELALVISKKFGFQIKSDDADITAIFSSLRSLTAVIDKRRLR